MSDASRPALIARPCFQQDLEMVQLIYAHHVLTGTGTFEVEAPDMAEMTGRWGRIVERGWPFLVACPVDDLSRVMGFAYGAQFRERAAYAKSFEVSVYTAPTAQRLGVGATVLTQTLVSLRDQGAEQAVAYIGDSANAASIGLHSKLGFRHVGTLRNIGEKFGKALDVVIMQRGIAAPKPRQ
jgi:phosphinothricin acetyltransferase